MVVNLHIHDKKLHNRRTFSTIILILRFLLLISAILSVYMNIEWVAIAVNELFEEILIIL